MARYIDTEDFIKRINHYPPEIRDIAKKELRYTHTADVQEVVHGKWEDQEVVENKKIIEEWQSAKCSVCGKYHTTPYMYYFDDFNYCPNCGADMRGKCSYDVEPVMEKTDTKGE